MVRNWLRLSLFVRKRTVRARRHSGRSLTPLPPSREREGPGAKRWEGEGLSGVHGRRFKQKDPHPTLSREGGRGLTKASAHHPQPDIATRHDTAGKRTLVHPVPVRRTRSFSPVLHPICHGSPAGRPALSTGTSDVALSYCGSARLLQRGTGIHARVIGPEGKQKFMPPCRELRERPAPGALLDRRGASRAGRPASCCRVRTPVQPGDSSARRQ